MQYGLFFGTQETIKTFIPRFFGKNSFDNFYMNFFLAICTQLIVYPLDIARNKLNFEILRGEYNENEFKPNTIKNDFFKLIKTSKETIKLSDSKTLFNGIHNRILKSVFPAISFTLYDYLKSS